MTEAIAYAPGRIAEVADHHERVAELRRNARLARHIDDHPLLPVSGADPAYASMCGNMRDASMLTDVASRCDAGARMLRDAGGGVDLVDLETSLVQTLADDGIETYRVVQSAPFETRLRLNTVMTIAPGLSQLDFGWEAQRVRTSSRPLEQSILLTGRAPGALRDLPHPFS